VQCERDEDGRWLAKMPGAIAYGATIEEAMAEAEALALRVAVEEGKEADARSFDASRSGLKSGEFGGDTETVFDAE
jgi:predicted RNase H-like HicB family nuclease